MHLHIDPIGGIAGDMFCAALLDAFPAQFPPLQQALSALEPPVGVGVELHAQPGHLHGRRFLVTGVDSAAHGHTAYRDIKALLQRAALADPVRQRALDIFHILAKAEAYVHGVEPEAVTFHEVGNWDAIIDIVSAAWLLEQAGVTSASLAPLPLGSGRVHTAHGLLPVPAPATLRLLEGLPVHDDGIGGERVTPTGAAIVKSLDVTAMPACGVLKTHGSGFGSRHLEKIPNCVRVLLLAAETVHDEYDRVAVVQFDVDDQTPEDLAIALEHLRALPGVLSVTVAMLMGKRGRPTMQVELLARPSHLADIRTACFRETTTLGIRWHHMERQVLPRRAHQAVTADGHTVDVKTAQRPGGATTKVESRDLAQFDSHAAREALNYELTMTNGSGRT